MKQIILLAACILTISTVKAQEQSKPVNESLKVQKHEKPTPEQRAQKHVEELNNDVILTEAQKPKVYDLALIMVKKNMEVREKYKGQPDNRETAKREIKAARMEYHQTINTLLTQEQSAKLKAKQKAIKEARKQQVAQ